MIRGKFFSGPLGALALGGLLLADPVAVTGQPQDKPQPDTTMWVTGTEQSVGKITLIHFPHAAPGRLRLR
jgi:hypothetical protein